MRAIEFLAETHSGILKLPESLKDWHDRPVKVILMRDEEVAKKTASRESLRVFFAQFNVDLSNFKFDRDEANER